MSQAEVIYIVAGNYEQFRAYRAKKFAEWDKQDKFPDYHYVNDVSHLKGLNKIQGFFIGTYDKRKDIQEIQNEINIIKNRTKNIKSRMFLVNLNGVLLNPFDYDIKVNYDGTEVSLSFHQALPADSTVVITRVDGMMISTMPVAGTTNIKVVFPLTRP
jgi:hypothetical protein